MDSRNYYERSICKQKVRREIASISTIKNVWNVLHHNDVFELGTGYSTYNVYDFRIFNCGTNYTKI